ncbi:MAG: aminotransferase class I/II-fold pyridoxal phosphate-dependent enzyme, partial [Acidimicrobiia bacterium]|nr:aminotransferase class I/II-fold pyridoxal phosphate-dependent enzyme [Acidimicrobiia bacterium]
MATTSPESPTQRNRVSERLAAIAPSATMAVDGRAKELKAAGEDVISYGAGEPDFPTPDHVLEAAHRAVDDPVNHRYSANVGLIDLREAVVESTRKFSGVELTPEQILITNGAKQSVFQALSALAGPSDEVLIPSPYWVTYPEAVALTGATPVNVPTVASQGYKVTPDLLDEFTTNRTKVLLFVSPSNPTGAVYSSAETKAIRGWAGDRGVWVITDEIYQHLVYGDAQFTSIVESELEDRWIIINGVSKSHAMTGWRVGWMAGPT